MFLGQNMNIYQNEVIF